MVSPTTADIHSPSSRRCRREVRTLLIRRARAVGLGEDIREAGAVEHPLAPGLQPRLARAIPTRIDPGRERPQAAHQLAAQQLGLAAENASLRGGQLGDLRAQLLDFRVHGIGAGGCVAMLRHSASSRT